MEILLLGIFERRLAHTHFKRHFWGAWGFGFYFKKSDLLVKVHFYFKHAFKWEACTVFSHVKQTV